MPHLRHRCDRSWDDLAGTGPRRWCDRCARVVHDLDALPPAARRRVLGRASVCVRFVVAAALAAAPGARADDAPRPGEGPLPELADPQEVMGALDPSPIRAEVARHHEALRALYDRHRRRRPALAGKLVVRFTIEAGRVTEAAVARSTLGHPPFEEAVLELFREMTFPAGRGKAVVHYPLQFAPPDR